MKKLLLTLTIVFALAVTTTSCKKDHKEPTNKETATVLYQCPMDCEKGKSYTEKGSCPVCKMDLKAKKAGQKTNNMHKAKEEHDHQH